MERYFELIAAKEGKVGELLRIQGGLTKKQISQMKFRPGGIRKNGIQCRVTERAVCGDVIRICLETRETDSSQLLEGKPLQTNSDFYELEILYEDQDILAVNKPAGLVTHPSGIHYQDSLSNLIAQYFRSKGEGTRIRSIGRLDKETSGILLFARNQISAARLQKQREEGKLRKTYLAAVEGTFENKESEISIPLAPDPKNHLQMVLSFDGTLPGSKAAVTCYKVLESYDNASLVQLQLKTGRTHQIRVHMAGTGHPLLGDRLYNKRTGKAERKSVTGDFFTRAALHGWKLVFYHPFTGEKILLEAPLPQDFEYFLEKRKSFFRK